MPPLHHPALFSLLATLGASLALATEPAMNSAWTEVVEHVEVVTPPSQRTTLVPQQSATLTYIGLFPTVMQLQRQQDQYEITVTANIPFRQVTLRSRGTLVNNQLQPLLFQDIRNGQVYAQTVFDHQRHEIRQGKTKDTPTVTPMIDQAFDPFSLAWQLSLNQGIIKTPFQLATGKGDVKTQQPETLKSDRVIRSVGSDSSEMAIQLITLPNQKNSSYGLAIDVGFLPAIFGFEDYALTLESISIDGQNYGLDGQPRP
ncbi:MAG: hypothetical protein ACTJHL_12500 [Neisseriaceae bacterium]